MFGGLTFMVAGNMCCGVHHDDLILRLDRETVVADLNSPHARAWDFMKRPMKGIFPVSRRPLGRDGAQARADSTQQAVTVHRSSTGRPLCLFRSDSVALKHPSMLLPFRQKLESRRASTKGKVVTQLPRFVRP